MGPLNGIKIIEMAGIGPGPFCAMLLADLGADVVRLERPQNGASKESAYDVLSRGRRSVSVDLKSKEGVDTALQLISKADALIEGFRPGVMERLGLGPEVCLELNPALVFGRMTGWGQFGPLANAAGHDINYISLTGALAAIGTAESGPVAPLNLVGDFGGGSMYLAIGILSAILEAKSSGQGQVVDAAMTDGAAHLMSLMYSMKNAGRWSDERASNLLDGSAPFYGTFKCADESWVSLGPLEPQFYKLFLEKVGFSDHPTMLNQMDRASWAEKKQLLVELFLTKPRQDWCELLEGTDVCFAPVLTMAEAPEHPHNKARETFVTVHDVVQPAPAPRFSRTPGSIGRRPPNAGEHNDEVMSDWGVTAL
ncbi:CaiB/BaiF CoA transferase family protein [Thalassovita taeanensis]|uniref:Alpha-methylacyl-CoA racemase n=1 Tax=Thalassovita taeanensis TaxID=657014 RepID=A0A1H9HAS4_9RHOB|nr:CaiB/BaiF CoA-transferase family protein [Thalassovita taeanensis]SEQ59434.1 alpha-methylacyl-CoA racemase [Thalassovita taeanensis]